MEWKQIEDKISPGTQRTSQLEDGFLQEFLTVDVSLFKNGSFDVRLLLKVTQKPLSNRVGVNMRPVKKLMCYYKTLQTHSFLASRSIYLGRRSAADGWSSVPRE